MISLVALTAFSSLAQTSSVTPIILVPDSTEGYRVTRPWMEWALHEIEMVPLQLLAIDDLREEVVAAGDQVFYRDMTIENLVSQSILLEAELLLAQEQIDITQESVAALAEARRRASLRSKVAGAAAVVLGVIAVLK